MDRTRQQDIATFAHAAAGAQRGRVVFDLNSVSGLKAAEGRQVVVTLDYPELGRILGAIPASELPDGVTAAMGAVLRWLRAGQEPAPGSRPSFTHEPDPEDSGQWRVVELSDDEDRSGLIAGWTTSQYAQQNAGIAARLLTELGGRLPRELAEMIHYTPNERG